MTLALEEQVMAFLMVAIPVYLVAFTLYVVRVVKGPTLPDRVLAIDALSFDLAAFLVILSIFLKSPVMVTTALVLALWIYALDVYIAKYLEYREIGD